MIDPLTDEDKAQGYTRPLRSMVRHDACGRASPLKFADAQEFARNPTAMSSCYCMVCGHRYPVSQFIWTTDGEAVGS